MITPMRVFVLIFNAGTDNEGIHTIRVGDRNTILMFESEDDATRFALMLEAQDFPIPAVEAIDAEQIKEFCQSADYDWQMVTENSALMVPPEVNVEETDWKPDSEIEQKQTNTQSSNQESPSPESQLSDSELDSIRRRLEGLL
ncbi:MAG: DUF3110 domain-containing protein [Pelatocladus maniniholoensis HA4357-MV3]|jgi:hypothetical protein|uniref:DUF3110 domain-containing protein n=1 Tax=Pelatocladus maniniholoensis HA4357-MV3 TaxID=1117104 RepID=A0A9E3H5I2_9NOST|nr:DUF3110 domain-containing protein [Pelatocladus maniniholoensis HA4357-MV3]BAZ69546.1 hypothetical protein NIES4106_43190 [Fischerella sp. NIES-4106]